MLLAQGPPGDIAAAPGLQLAPAQPESVPWPAPTETLPTLRQPTTDGTLTLAELESLAIANHPALRTADGQLRAERGRWVQVGLLPNPVIGYMGNEIGNEGSAGQQGGYVSQDFVTAGKLDLNRAVALRNVAMAEQRFAVIRLKLLTTVRSYYFETLAAERAVTLAQQLEQMSAHAVRTAELRLAAEEGSRAAVLQSQIERESVALLAQQAAGRLETARRRLWTLVGLSETQPQALDDGLQNPLPDLTWETMRSRLLAESPALAEARFAVDRARWAVARATAGRVPDVNVQGSVQYDDAARDTIAGVQISVPLPVFDRNQGAIAAACGELAAAQAGLDEQQLALENQLAAVLRDYLTARARVTKYAEVILPAARESRDMINGAYEQGELDYLQLLSAQRTYTEKHLAYLQDLATAWKTWAVLEGLLAGRLDGGTD
jgi:cobalt-zinc-cadmium efflux system outer membrane protein